MLLAFLPSLRFALHALLALAVVLQASTAVAMHAAPALGATGETPASLATESTLPPCHSLAATVMADDAATAADCCGDPALGESCRWACAQALGETLPLVFETPRRIAANPDDTPILPAIGWTALSPHRPPIG